MQASTPATEPPAAERRPGTMQLTLLDGRVTLDSKEVSQAKILEALAARGGFELVARGSLAERLTIRMSDAPLAEAVSLIVGPLPYQMEFVGDDDRGSHRLARLRIGEPPRVADAVSASPRHAALREHPGAPSVADFELQRDVESRYGEPAVEEPALRRQQVADLDVDREEDVEVLFRYAEEDPDPTVRKAAVEQLADAPGSGRVVAALVARLSDPDRDVVVASLDALEWQDDARALIALEQMLEEGSLYQDPELRELVVEAIDWIGE